MLDNIFSRDYEYFHKYCNGLMVGTYIYSCAGDCKKYNFFVK